MDKEYYAVTWSSDGTTSSKGRFSKWNGIEWVTLNQNVVITVTATVQKIDVANEGPTPPRD